MSAWEEAQRLCQLIDSVGRRGWSAAAHSLRESLDRQLTTFRSRLEECHQQVKRAVPEARSSVRTIFDELAALEQEFDQVRCNLKHRTLTAVTAPIVLKGVYLGPFEVVLEWNLIGIRTPYYVVPLEPNRASSNDEVPHPHVNGSSLCEGDGQEAIRDALSQGRIFDFFVLVRQILETYNAGNAYVSLSDWDGVNCGDCGCTVPADDARSCDTCDCSVCSECCFSCERCWNSLCSECKQSCTACGNYLCPNCLRKCSVCEGAFCSKCLPVEQCKSCQESNDESEEIETRAPADAEVQPLCVGQVAVPA